MGTMDRTTCPLVSIIIVCWNSVKYLPLCLESISKQTFRSFEVIIVDNGSQDNSTSALEEKFSNIDLHIERMSSNLGFAAANNAGARIARGKWLILLNTDAFPEPSWLEKLVNASQSNPHLANFSSRQIQANRPELLDSAGDAYHVSGLAWHIDFGYPSNHYGQAPGEIFSPCAAAA